MKFMTIYLLAFTSSFCAFTHRYVCNGILANGVERHDECGVCDDEHAARWDSPNIPIVVDYETLPFGVTKKEWQGVVDDSFAAWNTIKGTSLRFFALERENARNFGDDEALHEIFWIKNKEEWRKLVGVGEFGTLGATLPRYSCGGGQGAKRRIFDADLVMNGVESDDGTQYVNWRVVCPEDEDCISIQTTLVHELGHFLGLDHPCLMCSSSIMSARAGYDLMVPMQDDINGVRALYPQTKTNNFAASCSSDTSCAEGFQCIERQGSSYCSNQCTNDNQCENGGVCELHDGQGMCILAVDGSAPLRKLGQNCNVIDCEAPLECRGQKEEFYCFKTCATQDDCQASESCVLLEDGTTLCVALKNKSELCDGPVLCHKNLACVKESTHSGYCRSYCNFSDYPTTGCAKDELCTIIENKKICMPEKEGLSLDNNSVNFNPNAEPRPGMGRVGKRAQDSMGCSTYHAPSQVLWWSFFMCVFLLKRTINCRRSTR